MSNLLMPHLNKRKAPPRAENGDAPSPVVTGLEHLAPDLLLNYLEDALGTAKDIDTGRIQESDRVAWREKLTLADEAIAELRKDRPRQEPDSPAARGRHPLPAARARFFRASESEEQSLYYKAATALAWCGYALNNADANPSTANTWARRRAR